MSDIDTSRVSNPVRIRCLAWLSSRRRSIDTDAHCPDCRSRLESATSRATTIFVLACFPLHAFADAKAGEDKAQLCMSCHKAAPDKRFVPLLEQQPADYLVAATMAYKMRRRIESSMNVNAANLSDADIRDISDYFASKEFPSRTQSLDPAKIAAGDKRVQDMNCASCHGRNFRGAGTVPRLAQQNVMYLIGQMEAFRDGRRSLPPGMAVPSDRTDIENVASYLASVP